MTDRERDFRFVRRPKWAAGHIIVLVSLIVFVMMGFWQLRRLDDTQGFNSILTSRTAAAARPLDDVLIEYAPSRDELELRSVVATGTYAPEEEIILLAKSYNDISGHHVLTPLYLGDGRAVIVDRGWVAIDVDQPGMSEFAVPLATVDVYGILRKTEIRGSFGPVDPSEGILVQTARVDLERIDQQVRGDVVPVYIQLQGEDPASAVDLPALVPIRDGGYGPGVVLGDVLAYALDPLRHRPGEAVQCRLLLEDCLKSLWIS